MEKFISNSAEETINIAKRFAKSLAPGDIVLLDGDLGAGKTIFSKGIVSYFSGGGVTATSPTFVTMNIYDTTPKIYHFDLYRLSNSAELDAVGAEEYIYGDGISLIEWPTNVENYFPQNSVKVYIKKISDNSREIQIER